MSDTIALVSAKGGTGKTTTALNLAVPLAESGLETVLVDLDPQGGVALSLAKGDGDFVGLAEVLSDNATLGQGLVQTKIEGLSLLPRGRVHPAHVGDFERALCEGNSLTGILDDLASSRDVVLLDCPSGIGSIPRAALAHADWALIPLQAEPAALRTSAQALQLIEHVQQSLNPELRLLGILATMVDLDHDPSVNVMRALWSGFSGVFDTVVPRSRTVTEAAERGLPVGFLAGRTRPEARRFQLLAEEIRSRIARFRQSKGDTDEQPERALL